MENDGDFTEMPEDIKTVTGSVLPPEPAAHDNPDGPTRGWSAADFSEEDYASPEEQERLTEDVADGTQEEVHE